MATGRGWAGGGQRSLNLKASLPPSGAWQASAALVALAGIIAFTGAAVLAGGLVAAPAFVAFLRAGGWPKIRRRVAWATGATWQPEAGWPGSSSGSAP